VIVIVFTVTLGSQ